MDMKMNKGRVHRRNFTSNRSDGEGRPAGGYLLVGDALSAYSARRFAGIVSPRRHQTLPDESRLIRGLLALFSVIC